MIALALYVAWPRPRLAYSVDGGVVSEGGFVAPDRGGSATLRFTDGSTIALASGTRARVAEVSAHGARVVLEDGRVHAQIVHTGSAAWSIEAGPFAVAVTGTAFDVGWRAADEAFDVRMNEGAVVIRGPQAQDGIALRAGQRLLARPHEGELRVEADVAPNETTPVREAERERTSPDPAPAPPAASETQPPGASASASPRAPGAPDPARSSAARATATWAQRVATGDFASVLTDAESRGIDATLSGAPLADLVALADAARYGGRADLARRALEAERARFPASREAVNAAFFLARIAEEARGSPAAAIALYDQYLAAAPGGPLASEAQGRKMMVLRRSGGLEAARDTAAAYLRRYPDGAYAAAAREITRAP